MSVERPNPYAVVHKGIRALLLRVVEQAGRTDYTEGAAVEALRAEAERAFQVLESHAEHEDRFVAPLIRAAAPQVARALDDDHGAQEARLEGLRSALAAVGSEPARRASQGHAFTVALSRFAGDTLVHMAEEEERAMPALWAALDDASIEEVHNALVASIPPAQRLEAATWMLPAMSAPERAQLLDEVRRTAPRGAFEALLGVARGVLDPGAWTRLEGTLAPPAA
jgi:hypothetical protein